jgi:thiol-disulfide isomerase/thioredoxin
MTADDRLIRQSTEVLAGGIVDVNGKKVAVRYALVERKKVNAREGWLGVDTDGDGKVDMDNLSPEAAKADNEAVIFRVGNTYVSTKKADIERNQIVLREHDAKEYKRFELYIGKEFPEFTFSDFDGKKRKFSEFRGKYVLLDIWGFWCPPCRKELPYIREAHKRFGSKNLEVIGLNTDADYTIDSMKKALKDNGMIWTQAKFESVVEFLSTGLRINSFPTTFLISPEGKIISMGRAERKEPDLRGADLLDSLDEVLSK